MPTKTHIEKLPETDKYHLLKKFYIFVFTLCMLMTRYQYNNVCSVEDYLSALSVAF